MMQQANDINISSTSATNQSIASTVSNTVRY
jgi:hypothetical protein